MNTRIEPKMDSGLIAHALNMRNQVFQIPQWIAKEKLGTEQPFIFCEILQETEKALLVKVKNTKFDEFGKVLSHTIETWMPKSQLKVWITEKSRWVSIASNWN
jgi:hypothetical protein